MVVRKRSARHKRKKGGQPDLPFAPRGGKRPGAGRPPKPDSGVSHLRRDALAARYPVFITVKLRKGLRDLRNELTYKALDDAFRLGCDRLGFRLIEYSIQSNHMHLIAEAKNREALSRGMQGLLIRIAKALNKLWRRKGKVFADRYHDRILRTPRSVRNALVYVLQNARRHGVYTSGCDPYSSAVSFDGWRDFIGDEFAFALATSDARTWLLCTGWRRHGRIDLAEAPRAPNRP